MGIKLNLCRNVLSFSLHKNLILVEVAQAHWILWQLKLPIYYNGKDEYWHLLLTHCRYFDKEFYQICLLSGPYSNIESVSKLLNSLVAMAIKRLNIRKNQKPTPQTL